MKIELKKITVRELSKGYADNAEQGVWNQGRGKEQMENHYPERIIEQGY